MTGPPDAAALAWLPLVGVVIGGLAGLAAWGVAAVAPAPLVTATAFGASIVLSGAMHLDGLLDASDALFASVPPERRREIMRDPHHGTFAFAGFAVTAALWLAALAAIPAALLPWALAFAGGTARLGAVLNAFAFPYGPGGSTPEAFERRPPAGVLVLAAAVLAGCALAVHAPLWLAAAVAACVAARIIGSFAAARLAGALPGDVYGATIVVLDVLLLIAVAVLHEPASAW